jgi:hypothetical protein
VDISLDTTSGLVLIKAIKRGYEDLPVLVVSMHSDSLYGNLPFIERDSVLVSPNAYVQGTD